MRIRSILGTLVIASLPVMPALAADMSDGMGRDTHMGYEGLSFLLRPVFSLLRMPSTPSRCRG